MSIHSILSSRFSLVVTAWLAACLLFQPAALWAQADAATRKEVPAVERGYELPEAIRLYRPRGTGQTTGHIATLTVENNTDAPYELPSAMFYIPMGNSGIQGYVARPAPGHVIPAGATADVPVNGYCNTVRLPPAPDGAPLPPPEEWIVATGESSPVSIPSRDSAGPPGNALVPGTDSALPRAVSMSDEPMVAVPLLFAAITEIERTTEALQESGDLVTPFTANPEREREAVNQQVFWIFAAELENEPYTKDEFTERLEAQYEDNTGVAVVDAPEEDQERVQQGADDFWAAFELVGTEAKVINVSGAAAGAEAGAKSATEPEGVTAQDPGGVPPAEEVEPPACTFSKSITHTDRVVNVTIADSYGDNESRKKITDGIRNAVQSESNAYATATPPSTAYAIWRNDHIGGISSAYAKTVFLEDDGQEWVWSTDPMSTSASGTGNHTLSSRHGPECSAVVAGAALLWIKGSSEAFDPLEKNIEFFRALDAVKEASVKFVTRKLPPGIDDAIEAGVDAITDPSSDTYASATGGATLTVGNKVASGTAKNNVVYKREDKEDKAIIGGGETIEKFQVSDSKPDSLTSRINASAVLEAGAEGNGYANAYLESLYGTILVGVCECPTGIVWDSLTEARQFVKTSAAQAAVDRAIKEMQEAADRIDADLKSGAQKIDGDTLKARAEAELARWARSIGGDRFETSEE